MKANELSKYLETLLSISKYRSILVDGPWGCGKTYEIREFIKKHKNKCIYVSLFGLETIDEINTEIYRQSHKGRVRVAKVSNAISKAVAPVKYVSNIADALAFQLNEIDTSRIKKSKIVIVDDLERLSKLIEYKDLVGYINKLLMNEARIICLVSLEGLEGDSNRLRDFLEFREKVFDSCLSINQSPTDVFDNLFNKYSIENSELIYQLFNDNIRMAKKTELLFSDILKVIKSSSTSKTTLSEYEILKVCAYTILCVVGFNDCGLKFKDAKSYESLFYKHECEEFGENVANGFVRYFSGRAENNDNYLKPYVQALIKYYRYMDPSLFLETISIRKSEETDILGMSPFYLSDGDKKKYFDEFVYRVKTTKEWNDLFEKCVRAIYADTDFELPDDVIRLLATLDAQTKQNKNHTDKSSVAFDYFPGRFLQHSKQSHFVDIYHEEYTKAVFKRIADEIENTVKNGKYERTIDLLKEVQYSNNPVIKDMLIVNSFFIPDLSGEITESQWSFCHKVANIAERLELKNEYKNIIRDIYQTTENKTNSLRTRLWALVYYGLNEVSFKECDLDSKKE